MEDRKIKKRVFIILVSCALAIVLTLLYLYRDGGHHMGRGSDAKVVREVPVGFIRLSSEAIPSYKGGGDWDNGMRHVSWESVISFLDVDKECIYQTSYSNSGFIVKYNNEYYVNEAKILELIDIVNSKQGE